MNVRLLAALASLAFLALAPACLAAQEPYELVRSLQALEDQLARGDAAAQAEQPRLIADIADQFLAADPAVWRAPRNARAAIAYLLSGGQSRAVRPLVEADDFAAEYRTMAKGALAYAEGRDDDARKLLAGIDARTLPSTLGGHLALVQAMLIPTSDQVKARPLLDLARLLLPGTLVEEAALRRAVILFGDAGETSAFTAMSRRYVHRFQHSVYAGSFRQRIATSIANFGASGDLQKLRGIESLIGEFKPDEQCRLYLSIAQSAVIDGRNAIAAFAADKAAGLAGPRSREAARAALYAAAAMVVTDKYEAALARLQEIDSALLPPRDVQLRDAALGIARTLRRPAPVVAAAVAPSPPSAPSAPVEAAAVGKSDATIGLAEKALADADNLLQKAVP